MSDNSTLPSASLRTSFVGLDLGDGHFEVCIFDRDGEVIEESRIPTEQSALRRKFAGPFSELTPCERF